jgi:plasmid stabilization system protein ParE
MSGGSPDQASALLERLRAATRDLAKLGRMVPGIERDFLRELIVERYRIIYEFRQEVVSVATILHGAQDISTRLHELWPDLP